MNRKIPLYILLLSLCFSCSNDSNKKWYIEVTENTSDAVYGVGYVIGNTSASFFKGIIDGVKDTGLSIKDFSVNAWDTIIKWIA